MEPAQGQQPQQQRPPGEDEPARPAARRRWQPRVALALAATLLALGCGEVLCRLLTPPPATIRFEQDVKALHAIGLNDLAQLVESDPDLFWRLTPSRTLPHDSWPFHGLIANAQGLREDHEVSAVKPAGTLRILFLGDSCTFGYGLEQEQSFVRVCQQILQARFPDRRIECINAGVPGYTAFQGWRFLETRGWGLKPDIVIATFGWNENYMWDNMGDVEHDAMMRAAQPPALLRWSRLCQLAWSAWPRRHNRRSGAAGVPRLYPWEYAAILNKMDEATRSRGIGLGLVVWPHKFNITPQAPPGVRDAYQAEVARRARRLTPGAGDRFQAVIDLVPVARDLAKSHKADELYFDDEHANMLANRAFGQAIADRLGAWLALPPGQGRGGVGQPTPGKAGP